MVSSTGKNKYGYLLYDDKAVKRIQEIKMYQDFGFALKDLKVLFASSVEEYMEQIGDHRERIEHKSYAGQSDLYFKTNLIVVHYTLFLQVR